MQGNDGIDYKKKYMDLRARFVEALDIAFRTGYEQGANEQQVQNMAQQAQMQAQQAAMMQGQITGGPGMDQPPGAENPESLEAADSEMDAAISELEGLVNKSEPSVDDMKKSIEALKNSRMHQKLQKATKEAGKKLNQPPKPLSLSYKVNLPEESKQTVSMQSKIVDDILNKWEQEAQNSAKDITSVLGTEVLAKKE